MNAKHTSRYNLSIKQCSRPNVAPPDLQTFNLPLHGWLCPPSDPLYIEILSLQYSTVQYSTSRHPAHLIANYCILVAGLLAAIVPQAASALAPFPSARASS